MFIKTFDLVFYINHDVEKTKLVIFCHALLNQHPFHYQN